MKTIVKLSMAAVLIAATLAVSFCGYRSTTTGHGASLTTFVDPYIGSGDHGHVFVGANVPYGLVQIGPTQLPHDWDWCSGYHYTDTTIRGFGLMHLSGTGIGDLGDINIMPVTGPVLTAKGTPPNPESGMYSFFSHDNETVRPGYYRVLLDRWGITAEMTATQRVGFQSYTFPASEEAGIIVDLQNGIGWDQPVQGYIVQENDTIVSGYRYSSGWAKDQKIFFTMHFSKPMTGFTVYDGTRERSGTELSSGRTFGRAHFRTSNGEKLLVKTAISPVSIDNAKMNMAAELPGWNFEGTVEAADRAWNRELSRIHIDALSETDKKIFYTALYHTMIAPSVFCDVNGDYRGSDGQVYTDPGFVNCTTFSLWDTYRAAHPLMTIINPELTEQVGKTFLKIYQQQGILPVWHLMGNETYTMVGNSGVPVLADMILKGYDIDPELAFEAMKTSMTQDNRGLGLLKEYGYLPYDLDPEHETVAKGLEYALADWSVAQVALMLGYEEDYEYFSQRAKAYSYYFDPETKFMRGLSSAGQFREPFDPFRSTHREDDYTEGNAWQYTWLVPHDVHGLVELFGGEQYFIPKLDSLFVVEGDMGEDASPDISGLIGTYAHGNEPSHQVIYMYPYVGQQWKAAELSRRVLSELYFAAPAGLPGNEDVGQMSSWYVLSAVGLYQVEPAGGKFIFGSPAVHSASLNVVGDRNFEIVAHKNSAENIYIQSVKLNGEPYTKSYIMYDDIAKGGKLEFWMGNKPSSFGTAPEDRP